MLALQRGQPGWITGAPAGSSSWPSSPSSRTWGTSILGLTGGEPLLREDLEDLIAAIDDRSVSILYSSGSGLTRARARDLAGAGLFAAGISLDRTDPATFDRMRGHTGAWEASVTAIDHLRSTGRIHVMVQCVVDQEMPCPGGSTKPSPAWPRRIGAHEIRFLEAMPAGRSLHLPAWSLPLPQGPGSCSSDSRGGPTGHRNTPRSPCSPTLKAPEMFGCGAGTQHSYLERHGQPQPL